MMKKSADKFSACKFPLLLVLVTMFVLVVMELRHPYFFLQDDNRDFHLPYYVHNLNALLEGELPIFNFHQYLGTPVSFLAAPFYPLNYLAMLLSRFFLGHYFGVMEFIAAIHLLIAVIGFYRFSREFRLQEVSCCFGAIAWGFSPFVITIGNSWIHTLGYAAYLPWILLFSIRQMYAFNRRSFVLLVLLRLLALLLGYPQSFLYTATFDLLLVAALYVTEKRGVEGGNSPQLCSPRSFVFRYVSNYLVFLVMALPVLLQLLHEAGVSAGRKSALSWNEYAVNSYNLKQWLHGVFAPFLDVDNHLFGEQHYVSHIGYLTVIFALFALLNVRKSSDGGRIVIVASLALMSFLWSADIIFTKLFYYLPVYNKFRFPFKLQFFTGFFLVTLATFGFNIFCDKLRGKGRGIATVSLAALLLLHTANFLVMYGFFPQRMISTHLDRPPFAEPLQGVLTGGRIVSAGPDVVWDGERVIPGNTVPTLGYNYAMLWGMYHFGGYEALLSEKNLHASLGLINNSIFNVPPDTALNFSADVPLDYFRTWGVKWYVVNGKIPLAGKEGLQLVHSDRFRNVFLDPAAKPLVFWADNPTKGGVEYKFLTNSIRINTERSSAGVLIVNVLHNPFFTASIDGVPLQVFETDDFQMSVAVPEGRHLVVLRYRDRMLLIGAMISLVCLLTAVIAGGVIKLSGRVKTSRAGEGGG